MNYRSKWQSVLMTRLREEGTVTVFTRKASEIDYISELKNRGKIEIVAQESGAITCCLKGSAEVSKHAK